MAMINHLREEREKRNLHQDDVATAIGISPKSVGRIERGEQMPSLEVGFKLAEFYEMSIYSLFNSKE